VSHKLITFCVTILLIFTCSCTAFAKEVVQSKVGSISVTLIDQKQNKAIVGAELSIYYVATAILDADGNLIYDYTKEFEQLDTAIDDKLLVANLDVFVSQHSVPSIKMTTNEEGMALCNNLSLGLYFVRQTGDVEGYAPCTPFLVTIPNEKNGEYIYDVNASPKTEVARLTSITIEKVWNTDESTEATQNVKVQLLKDGKVIKTAILSRDNHWQITYTDMPESDAYSIREINVPKGFTATYKQNGYIFTVTNTSTLIQTGQLIWPISLLAMGGLVLISIGIALLKKKR
jgi:uncharacterized surface anchored protein